MAPLWHPSAARPPARTAGGVHDGFVQVRQRVDELRARLRERPGVLLTAGLVIAFLATRLPLLDADIPQWELTVYAPIDEFVYSIPGFNLVHYGTWVHQAAAWAPLEGQPTNVLQNVVVAATLEVFGTTYWGLRMSAIAFGLVGFLSLIALVRVQASEARRFDGVPARVAWLVVGAAGVLLLVDFSFVLSARTVEPTTSRVAVAALLVALVAHGAFLGERGDMPRTVAFGFLTGAAVAFVYVYNAFLVPGALVAVAWWAFRRGGAAAAVRHAAGFLGGSLVAVALYFGLISLVYHHSPLDWYHTWIAPLESSSRGLGISVAKVASILQANIFRLDPAFLTVALAAVPVFAWTLRRRPQPWHVLIVATLGAFLAQSLLVADYPQRKFIIVMLFALPIAAEGALSARGFMAWATADPRRLVAATIWVTGAILVGVWATPLSPVPPHGAFLARIVLASGLLGAAALVAYLVAPRPRLARLAAIALAAAILAPIAYADLAFIYRRPTFTFRDAQIAAAAEIGNRTTAGSLSVAMELYNGSRAVLTAFTVPGPQYAAAVTRFFREGGATVLYGYADPPDRAAIEALGFRLAETLPVVLPRDRHLGRYVYVGPAAAGAELPGG
jgi:hypothetical protein